LVNKPLSLKNNDLRALAGHARHVAGRRSRVRHTRHQKRLISVNIFRMTPGDASVERPERLEK
jgi:hypothetical protein